MTTDRAYRKARPTSEAIAELRRNSGTQLDPVVVDTLCAIVEEGDVGADPAAAGAACPARTACRRTQRSPGRRRPPARARKPGTGSLSGRRDDEHGAVVVAAGQRLDEQLEPGRERERLVRLVAAERDEVVRRGQAREHVAVRDLAHRHVRDERAAVRARNADRERRRADERLAALGVRRAAPAKSP